MAFVTVLWLLIFSSGVLYAQKQDLIKSLLQNNSKQTITLIKSGQALQHTDEAGRSALWIASWQGKTEVVQLLLDRKLNPNQADQKGATPLMAAAQKGHLKIVALLLKHRAHVNARDQYGRTALMQSMAAPDPEIARTLIRNKANVNLLQQNGWNALMMAVLHNHHDLIGKLVQAGAQMDAVNEYAENVMEIAIRSGSPDSVAELLKHGYAVNQTNPLRHGRSPLMTAAETGQATKVRLLLKHKAKLELTDRQGSSALSLAVQAGSYEATEALLEAGADPMHVNRSKMTPLQIAMLPENAATHSSIIKLLKKHGATK